MKKLISVLILATFTTLTSYTPAFATQRIGIDNLGTVALKGKSTNVTLSAISENFEKGLSSNWVREMANNTYSGAISTGYAQGGSHSFRVELRKTDANVNGSKRSEIATSVPEKPLEEHNYTFSTLLPKGGDEDYANDPKGDEIIAQWHNVPDPGEEWTMPPLTLHTYNGSYSLARVWDDAKLSTDEEIMQKGNLVYYNLGSYENDKGKFVTWRFHVKWGWLASQKPILEVYKNGVKILDLNGLPNTTNDQVGVHMKLGIYKWNWAQPNDTSTINKRVVYFDNVSIK